MKHYVKLTVIHPYGKDCDTPTYIRTDLIAVIRSATSTDRKQRTEINSVVELISGSGFGIAENATTVLAKINEAESSIPEAAE